MILEFKKLQKFCETIYARPSLVNFGGTHGLDATIQNFKRHLPRP